jgi:hypothetical protein
MIIFHEPAALILLHAPHPAWRVEVGTEVNKSHSSGSSRALACSPQTRMTQTVKGSLPARGAFRGGKSVI